MVEQALEVFSRELALEPRNLLYLRECAANTWYAIGACHLQQRGSAAADRAFNETIARVPGHLMARAALELVGKLTSRPMAPAATPGGDAAETELDQLTPNAVDLTLARTVPLVANGDATSAARLLDAALAAAPDGNAGWLIPIEPLLHVQHDRAAWTAVLARLRTRAS